MQSSFTIYKFLDQHNQYSMSVPPNYMIGEIDNMDLFVYEPKGELTISVEIKDIESAKISSLEKNPERPGIPIIARTATKNTR